MIRCVQVVGNGFFAFIDKFIKYAGPILIIFALLIVLGFTYVYFTISLPYLAHENPFVYSLHLVLGLFLLFNVVYNYICCIITHPGTYDTAPAEFKSILAKYECETDSSAFFLKNQSPFGYCKKCQAPKLPRSHHCQICQKCILHMDHHCPWVHNCVGFYNYQTFDVHSNKMDALTKRNIVLVFILSLSIGIAVGALWGWHLYLVLTGQTTIEFYQNGVLRNKFHLKRKVFKSEYDRGAMKNFQQIFGKHPYHWIFSLLPSRRLPPPILFPRILRDNVVTQDEPKYIV